VRAARERKSEADQTQQQFKASADAAGAALDSFRDRSSDQLAGSRAAYPAAAMEEATADTACSPPRREDVAKWWACIVELRNGGLEGTAAREQALLLEAYPEFTVPE